MSELRLSPGDLVPRLVLPDPSGDLVDLWHQSRAGRPILLWLAGTPPLPARAASVAGALRDSAADETLAFAVLRASPGDVPRDMAGLPVLCDPDGIVGRAVGTDTRETVVVFDSAARIVEVAPGAEAGAVVARAVAHEATSEAAAPVLTLPLVLEAELCARLVAYWHAGEKRAGGTSTGGGADGHYDASLKRRQDVPIGDRALYAAVGDRIRRRVFPQVQRAFQVRLSHFEAPRIGCYDAADAGFFGRHRDNRSPHTAHRLFAMSLNLETGTYEGGDLLFPEFGRTPYRPPAGAAVVFSCSLLHEATPVTRGRRFAVFSFFTDEAGHAREKALIAEQMARGNTGVTLR
ncbi:MAG: 2OG-Fe(II) oxygenase [Alphaproteobacteria bacterium]